MPIKVTRWQFLALFVFEDNSNFVGGNIEHFGASTTTQTASHFLFNLREKNVFDLGFPQEGIVVEGKGDNFVKFGKKSSKWLRRQQVFPPQGTQALKGRSF